MQSQYIPHQQQLVPQFQGLAMPVLYLSVLHRMCLVLQKQHDVCVSAKYLQLPTKNKKKNTNKYKLKIKFQFKLYTEK